jgi:hypothetical protein
MNALSVAWKLRVDMLTILAAASPSHPERDSQSQVIHVGRYRRHRSHSDPSDLGSSLGEHEDRFEDRSEQPPSGGRNGGAC